MNTLYLGHRIDAVVQVFAEISGSKQSKKQPASKADTISRSGEARADLSNIPELQPIIHSITSLLNILIAILDFHDPTEIPESTLKFPSKHYSNLNYQTLNPNKESKKSQKIASPDATQYGGEEGAIGIEYKGKQEYCSEKSRQTFLISKNALTQLNELMGNTRMEDAISIAADMLKAFLNIEWLLPLYRQLRSQLYPFNMLANAIYDEYQGDDKG